MHRSIIGKKLTLLPYHGWLVVAAAFLVALYGFGLGFYGPGIYLVALNTLHGWPISELSSAITTYYVLGATLLFFWVGPLFDRHGARKVVVMGTVAMACGVVLLAFVTQPWHVYTAFAVMSVGWATMSGAAINIIVAPWFDRRRGLALGWALERSKRWRYHYRTAADLPHRSVRLRLCDRIGVRIHARHPNSGSYRDAPSEAGR